MSVKEEYCFYCMEPKNSSENICPNCKKPREDDGLPHHLQKGTILNSKYLVGAVLGEGGFGITYIGRDLTLDMKVAIKEYYPSHLVKRSGEDSQSVYSTNDREEEFEKGKDQFLTEARTLAKFPYEDGIVGVRDFFQENHTVYIVMEYLEGVTLGEYLDTVTGIPFGKTLKMMLPIMNSLEKVHEAGLIHRDISPDNIMITTDGKVKLLDFGASRDIRQKNRELTVILKPSYAPEEQYRRNGVQGPWTDVYALCAVMYRCITGTMPEDSVGRVLEDELRPPSAAGAVISKAQEAALLDGMAVHQQNRIQTMRELKDRMMQEIEDDFSETRQEPLRDAGKRETGEPLTIMPVHTGKQQDVLERTRFLQEEEREKTAAPKDPPIQAGRKKAVPKKTVFTAAAAVILLSAVVGLKLSSNVIIGRTKYPVYSSQKVDVFEMGVKLPPSQIKALKRIKNLFSVGLFECWLTDREVTLLADVLEHKDSVYNVSLNGNKDVTDISPLEKLDQIKILNINMTGVKDLTPVSRLKQLRTIHMEGLGVSDLEFLNGLEDLNTVYADNNAIEDLTPLKNIPVSSLFLSDNQISDISVLKSHDNLAVFLADNNQIADISALSEKKNLSNVSLKNNRVSDVTPLQANTKLRYVYLNGNEIKDISSWQYLKSLTCIRLDDNQIENIDVLSGMKDLEKIYLSGNQIEDISALSGLKNLKQADLRDNQIRDISPLKDHTGLNPLLSGNQISDLTPLPSCYSLSGIDLSDNQISDLTVLGTMSTLKVLNLHGNPIDDFSPLAGLESINTLVFTYRDGIDLNTIKELPMESSGSVVIFDVPKEKKLYVEDLFSDFKPRVIMTTSEEWGMER